MSYDKKNNYPSVKTPGIYPEEDDRKLGLDTDDLNELSLGNWNSIFKGNKLFLSGDLLESIKTRSGIEVKFRTSPPKQGTRVLVWRYKRNDEQTSFENAILLAQGPIIEYLSEAEDITDITNSDDNAVKTSRLVRTRAVYEQFYNEVLPTNSIVSNSGNTFTVRPLDNQSFTNKAITFEDGRATIQEREGGDIVLTLDESTRNKLEQHHVFERQLDADEIRNWGDGAEERGNDKDFTHELIAMVEFDIQALTIDSDTLEEFESQSWGNVKPNDGVLVTAANLTSGYMNDYPQSNAGFITLRGLEKNLFNGPNKKSRNHPFSPTTVTGTQGEDLYNNHPPSGDFAFEGGDYNGGFGYYHSENGFGANIGAVKWVPFYKTDVKLGADFWPQELGFDVEETLTMGNTPFNVLPQSPSSYAVSNRAILFASQTGRDKIDAWDNHFTFIGYPKFSFSIAIDESEYVETLDTFDTPVDFVVNVKTDNGNDLLYYDSNELSYQDTSYPIKVNLDVDLYYDYGFENERQILDEQEVIAAFSGGSGESLTNYLEETIQLPYYAENPNECYYKYQVIQWGDEKRLLTDEQIESSYFFSFYDSEDYPKPEDYFYKKYQQSQDIEAIPIQREGARVDGQYNGVPNITNHVYNTPGIKKIKIIVYRYTPDAAFILQTYLITKNIVVGDGVLKSQDFSVFGGGDFNYIPITDNQAIIGGVDDDSKYNNSVEKLVKEDLFLKEDYLDRTSARDYIDKFNNGLLGESPSQLNLGQTRMFNKPKDIYDFIGGNRLEWISEGSGSLPLNSLATDIFINNDDCIVDLNPSNSDYSVLNNQVGLSGVGILVGDYELSQPEGGSVTKQGIMEIPDLDNTNDRQAF